MGTSRLPSPALPAAIVLLLSSSAFCLPKPHHIESSHNRAPGAPFRLCVPESAFQSCQKMVEQGATVGVHMTCVTARDRLDCTEKIEHHQADWGAVDPEDMFIAANKYDQYLSIFKEIRTKEEPNMEFRYEAVAVIHKDLDISSLEQLRGLASCHTGVGRNVGYKIPITKLTKMGILDPLNDTTISPRENELKALSNFFSKACIVGTWSPDSDTNQRLKATYSNLCQLCENPEKCDYPDVNSGYEGALNCLTKGGGQIAWTKTYFIKKFFGMPYATYPAVEKEVHADEYAYLCPDATKKPLTGPPCTWAARPWQGYMANTEINNELKELRDEIKKLNELGDSSHADWISTVLALNNKTLAVDNNGPYSPKQYLEKAKYMDVIERDVLKPQRKVKLCVTNKIEKSKCESLQEAAYSRDIRPSFACLEKPSIDECMAAVEKKEADILSIDPGFINKAERHNLEPVVSEKYIGVTQNVGNFKQYAIAVVKKSSTFTSLSSSNKVCLSHKGQAAGYAVPVYALIKKKLITQNKCPHSKALSEFFTAGIVESDNPTHCLESGQGDIAFTTYEDAKQNVDAENGDYEVLCDDNTRAPFSVSSIERCSLAYIPGRIIVANKQLTRVERDDILYALLSSSDFFSKNPHVFKMFGDYEKQQNVLFSNYAAGLVSNSKDNTGAKQALEDYKKMVSELDSCSSS